MRFRTLVVTILAAGAMLGYGLLLAHVLIWQEDRNEDALRARVYACQTNNEQNQRLAHLLRVTRPGLEREEVKRAWDKALVELRPIDCSMQARGKRR